MFFASSVIGFCMGFGFGVGCALAVQYGIFMHGYRAALKDLAEASPPARLLKEQRRLAASRHRHRAQP